MSRFTDEAISSFNVEDCVVAKHNASSQRHRD